DRLVLGEELALAIAGGKKLQGAGDQAGDDAEAQAGGGLALPSLQRPEGSHAGYREGAGDHRSAHGVRVLPDRPRAEEELRKVRELQPAVYQRMPSRELHEGIGDDDEVPGDPRP